MKKKGLQGIGDDHQYSIGANRNPPQKQNGIGGETADRMNTGKKTGGGRTRPKTKNRRSSWARREQVYGGVRGTFKNPRKAIGMAKAGGGRVRKRLG